MPLDQKPHQPAEASGAEATPGNGGVRADHLQRLMTWLSPAFPVGGFSYSHGLEWVVEQGGVRNAASLRDWIEDLLAHGAARTDLIFLADAWRAVEAGDGQRLERVIELSAAFVPSAERRLETLAQGAAFLAAVRAVWPHPSLERLGPSEIAYPVAVGMCTSAHRLDLPATARAFAQAFAANIVSAGVRLIPLGQTDGLRVLAGIEPLIPKVVEGALQASLDDIGGAAILADIASMRHETQYTRLFRS